MPTRLRRSAKDALVGIRTKVKSVDTLSGKGNLTTMMMAMMMMMMMILNVGNKGFYLSTRNHYKELIKSVNKNRKAASPSAQSLLGVT